MNQPRFVAKRVGNDYRIVRADPQGVFLSGLTTAGGAYLALKGLRHGGMLGSILSVVGAGVVYYGATGRNPIEEIRAAFERGPVAAEGGASHQYGETSGSQQTAEDEVDEAAMESFPASDPPASRKREHV